MMTRKGYEDMAGELRGMRETVMLLARKRPGFEGISTSKGADTLEAILDDHTRCVARVLERDNPRFDREKFMSAAGYRP